VLRRRIVHDLDDVRRLEAPGDVLGRVRGHALRGQVRDDGLLCIIAIYRPMIYSIRLRT
jgi:hypothetical protein